MNYKHRSLKLLISGSSGTGKTTYWLEYLHKCQHALKLVFDAEGEFISRGKHGIICTNQDELVRTCEGVFAGESKSNIVIFDPSVEFAGNVEAGFDWFCDWAFSVAQLSDHIPKIVATDELQNLIGTNIIPESFRKVLETGRRYSLDFVGITQALNLIHNRVRNQITELVAFRTHEDRALAYLETRGFDELEVGELRDLHFISRDLRGNKQTRGRLKAWKSADKIAVETDSSPWSNPFGPETLSALEGGQGFRAL